MSTFKEQLQAQLDPKVLSIYPDQSAGVGSEHIQKAAQWLREFGPSFIASLPDSHQAKLNGVKLNMSSGQAHEAGYAGGTLRLSPQALGYTMTDNQVGTGPTTPEGLFVHAVGQALDEGQSAPQFCDVHNGLSCYAVPQGNQLVMPVLPPEFTPLHAMLGGSIPQNDDQAARMGGDWLPRLSALAVEDPSAVDALDSLTPDGSTPIRERLNAYWGIPLPEVQPLQPERQQQLTTKLHAALRNKERLIAGHTHGSHKLRDKFSGKVVK